MSTSESCKVGANNYVVCDVNDKLQNMSTADEDNNISICANCGKEGANNICKCNQVRYCNAVCKKVHKKKHKKECDEHLRLAAEKRDEELRIAAELHDEKLFKQPPPSEDCPICMIRLPSLATGRKYKLCCGKTICSGCIHAPLYDDQGNIVDNEKCAFCRTVAPKSTEELIERYEKRIEYSDAHAMCNMGCDYRDGTCGFPQDYKKALELWHRSAELGYARAYNNIGSAYDNGLGVEVDKKKATYYCELGAMMGSVYARHNLGIREDNEGNMDRALRHYMIAVRNGHNESLKEIKDLYKKGHATKDDYMKGLQSYQTYLGEIKSDQRDKAAAADEYYRYY